MYKFLLTILLVFSTYGWTLSAQDPIISLPTITVDESEEFEIDVTLTNFIDIVAMQFTIKWDSSKMEYLEAYNYGLPSSGDGSLGFGDTTANTDLGLLPVSWEDKTLQGVTREDGTVAFTLRMRAMGNPGDTIALEFVGAPAAIEVADITLYAIPATMTPGQVIFEDIVSIEELKQPTITVKENYPNPFQSYTYIPLELLETTNITLTITDLSGKEIYRNAQRMSSGLHKLKIDGSVFPASGEYIYQVRTSDNQLIKKMTFVK